MWLESLLVLILFKFKKRPNISGIRVVNYFNAKIKHLNNHSWILDEHFFLYLVEAVDLPSTCFHLTEVFASRNISAVGAENPWNFLVHRWVWWSVHYCYKSFVVSCLCLTVNFSGLQHRHLLYPHPLLPFLESLFPADTITYSSSFTLFFSSGTHFQDCVLCPAALSARSSSPQATATELTSRAFPHYTWAHNVKQGPVKTWAALLF